VVHAADARPPPVLPLGNVEQRDDCRFFVLGGIAADDLVYLLLVLGSELERNGGVVVVCLVPRGYSVHKNTIQVFERVGIGQTCIAVLSDRRASAN
jgi:hypothetical protein